MIFHRPFVMARAPDAGSKSDEAFTGRTSELRGRETDPQPNWQKNRQRASARESEFTHIPCGVNFLQHQEDS